MFDSAMVGAGLHATQYVWAFVIIADHFKNLLQVRAIGQMHGDVRVRENKKTRKEPIQIFFGVVGNAVSLRFIENRILRVALTHDSSITDFSKVAMNGQSAGEAPRTGHGAVVADLLFLSGDLIRE